MESRNPIDVVARGTKELIELKTVTISRKYQVVIPKTIREQLKLVTGQTLQVIAYGDRIELLPVRSASELRGFLAGTDAAIREVGETACEDLRYSVTCSCGESDWRGMGPAEG